jgi:hypothetical protein
MFLIKGFKNQRADRRTVGTEAIKTQRKQRSFSARAADAVSNVGKAVVTNTRGVVNDTSSHTPR